MCVLLAVVGRHVGRLVLAGEEVLDGTSAAPPCVHVLARLLWQLFKADETGRSHTQGTGLLADQGEKFVIPTRKANHLQFLAFGLSRNVRLDSMPPVLWRFQMWHTHLYCRLRYEYSPVRLTGPCFASLVLDTLCTLLKFVQGEGF